MARSWRAFKPGDAPVMRRCPAHGYSPLTCSRIAETWIGLPGLIALDQNNGPGAGNTNRPARFYRVVVP